MAIEECQHCIKTVIFNADGTCPNCGKSKHISASTSRENILKNERVNELREALSFRTNKMLALTIGGTLLFMAATVVTVWTTMNGTVIFWWYGGIIAGLVSIWNGIAIGRTRTELRTELSELENNTSANMR